MAKLEGSYDRGPCWMEVRPIPSPIGFDALHYTAEFCAGEGLAVVSETHQVDGWQSGLDSLWRLSLAFKSARKIRGARLPFEISGSGDLHPAALYCSASWLVAVLWGGNQQERIKARFFVGREGKTEVFYSLLIDAAIPDAERFGVNLEEEIAAASPHWWEECSFMSRHDSSM